MEAPYYICAAKCTSEKGVCDILFSIIELSLFTFFIGWISDKIKPIFDAPLSPTVKRQQILSANIDKDLCLLVTTTRFNHQTYLALSNFSYKCFYLYKWQKIQNVFELFLRVFKFSNSIHKLFLMFSLWMHGSVGLNCNY